MTPPHTLGSKTTKIFENPSDITKKLLTRFAKNQMKANDDKFQLLLSFPDDNAVIQINSTIKCSTIKKY